MNTNDISDQAQVYKNQIMKSLQDHLIVRDFEVPGSNPALVTALAELLMFFALGPSDRSVPEEEKEWWLRLLGAMAKRTEDNG